MYRLFVAIDLPDPIRNELESISYGLPGAKWVDPSLMHITLKFIGEVDGADFRDAREALEEIEVEPFNLSVRGVGYFPPRGEPQMLWAGVEGNDRLVHLRNKVESTLVRAGFDVDRRKYKPHIRLAKIKETPPAKLAIWLREFALYRLPEFSVNEFCLFSSFLGSERAYHEVEQCYKLKKKSEVS